MRERAMSRRTVYPSHRALPRLWARLRASAILASAAILAAVALGRDAKTGAAPIGLSDNARVANTSRGILLFVKQSEAEIAKALMEVLTQCWFLPKGARDAPFVVRVGFSLKPDGTLKGLP